MKCLALGVCLFAVVGSAGAQENPAAKMTENHAVTEADGTVRMQRVMPLPKRLSPEARSWMSRPTSTDANVSQTIEQRRAMLDASQARHRDALLKMFAVTVTESTVAGVPVHEVLPKEMKHAERVLICLHGGGFNADSGSYSESLPVGGLTGTRVVSVLYRMAPEHPFPAAVDDVVAVYRTLLKTYKPKNIGIFGSSAGAGLTMQTAVRLKQLKLPLPGALGPFSVPVAMDTGGDSRSLYNSDGARGYVAIPGERIDPEYVRDTDPRDPVISPIYADLHGMPPALFLSSERDALLSDTSDLHRAYLRAGNDGRLIVFDALPHCFWNNENLPESHEAWEYMANFFNTQLGRR